MAVPVGYVAKNYKTGQQITMQADGTWSAPVPMANLAGGPVPPAITQMAAARVKQMQDAADTTQALDNQAHQVVDLNKQTGSGGLLGAPIIGGPLTYLAKQFDPALAAMDNLNVGMAKNMRAPGQRLTQMEWSKNLGVTPGPSMTPEANAAVTGNIDKATTMAKAQTAFYSTWLTQHHTVDGNTDAAWQTFKGQHFADDGTYYHDPATKPAAPAAAPDNGYKLLGVEGQ